MSENRLGRETSPYLLQHKDNPVHWWAWGPEALQESKRSGKPILLSVGYAACHWCHVMAHESFEDEATAAVMNELFVNIKVDREERPDIDAIYMGALHKLGQQGGWPLTMFLDTSARPFWGGTYFPKRSQWGRPAFADVLRGIALNFRDEPEKVANNANVITAALAERPDSGSGPEIGEDLIEMVTARLTDIIDPVHGGTKGAPKFPQWSLFWLLWRGAIRYGNREAAQAVETTLANICQGGIYDHLGGGFARYSTDERWLAPHFEKMLYDNALLIDLMTEVWKEMRNPLFEVRIAETVDWLLREMIAEGGGFAASLDADSEGEEGKFYVWSIPEIDDILGAEDAAFFTLVYDVSPGGNWEGHTILNRLDRLHLLDDADEARLLALRQKLLAVRDTRIRPGWDDKVLADWNGLMIAALARAAQVFHRPDWLAAAERAFAFVESRMMKDGRLLHSFRAGQAKAAATASDYANMIWAALRLHQATHQSRYLDRAISWTSTLDSHYWDTERGGYATSADDTADVIVRLCSAHDDAVPSANSIMLWNLVGLSAVSGNVRYRDRADEILRAFAPDVTRSLAGHTGLLASAIELAAPMEIVLAGRDLEGGADLEQEIHAISLPGALIYAVPEGARADDSVLLNGRTSVAGRAAVYACLGTQCSPPITDTAELRRVLKIQRLTTSAPQPMSQK